ncbi:uncharacterized mitochondrial protein AtMg00810-like [Aristolochia californica]|uniref:uncharacterized mitochondrial protein AtMg00810-like n=1 Tax=Aristolochia californica TaxID=171875 RepID=UPI0035DE3B6E
MKDFGQLTYFLGLEVHQPPNSIFLNQHKYIQEIITLGGFQFKYSVASPMEVNVKYKKDEEDLLDDPSIYRRLVGSLIYLTTTHRDISYVVHHVNQFISFPRHLHIAAVHHIIHYLRGSSTRGLFFPIGSTLRLVAYSDVDWARCLDTRRSTIGWCMFPQTSPTPLHADNTSANQIAANPIFHEWTKHIEVDCHSICDTLER